GDGGYPPRQPTGEEHRAENRQGSHARRDRSHDFRRPPAEMKDPPEDQYQALWAVNPDVSIERPGVLPQAGHLGVPAFIGGERRAPEGDAHEDREGHRRERRDRKSTRLNSSHEWI